MTDPINAFKIQLKTTADRFIWRRWSRGFDLKTHTCNIKTVLESLECKVI